MDNLYIIIPTYNESENIKNVVSDWISVVECIGSDSKLVIIDDGSKDNTYEILQSLEKQYPQLEAITKENEGHGATILFGYRYALKMGADYIFQTDSDGQTNPDEFQQFWNQRNNYDAIIGYRNKRQDGFSRIIVTKVLKLVLMAVFEENITDANTPFRLMSNEILTKYIDRVPNNYNLTNVLLSVIFIKNKEKVKFIPITFKPRQGGVNSINLKKIFKIGAKAVKDFHQLKNIV